MIDFDWGMKVAEEKYMIMYNELIEKHPFMAGNDLLKTWHDYGAHEQHREATRVTEVFNAMRALGIVIQFPEVTE